MNEETQEALIASPAPEEAQSFDQLIQGPYKEQFEAKLQEALEPQSQILSLLSKRYGTQESGALVKAMEADAAFSPSRAVQEGADRLVNTWLHQSREVKELYPGFQLAAEMANPRFSALLRNGIDLRTAYEVIHRDELIPAAMAFTARAVQQKLAASLASGGSRPMENGNAAQSAVTTKTDVTRLTREDREDIRRRVAQGERIRF